MKSSEVHLSEVKNVKRGEYRIITGTNSYWILVESRKVFDAPPILKEFVHRPLQVLLQCVERNEGAFKLFRISGKREVVDGFQSANNGSFDGGSDVLGDSQYTDRSKTEGSTGGHGNGDELRET